MVLKRIGGKILETIYNVNLLEQLSSLSSRQKRSFPIFSLLNFLLVVFNIVIDINNNINNNNNNNSNNNNNNNNNNLNMNGRW